MKKYIRNLSVFNKTVLFSTLIVVALGVISLAISYQVQKKMAKETLTQHALIMADLWRESLSKQDVIAAVDSRNGTIPEKDELEKQFRKIYELHPSYLQGYIMTTEKFKSHGNKIIVTANKKIKQSLEPSMIYYGGEEFYKSFKQAEQEKKNIVTSTYKDEFGTWITVLSPITNSSGKVVAMLGVDIDASAIYIYQKRLIVALIVAFTILFTFIIVIQDWGLRRLMSPLGELIEGIQAVSQGKFDVKLTHENDSELGNVHTRFNEMTERLQQLFQQVSATKEQLNVETNFSHSKDGIAKAIDELEVIMEKTRMQKELQRAEKMNAIGQLAASVAHEIRNPMTVVKGFLQLFQDNTKLSNTELSYIHLMINEMDRAEAIIHDYLSLAKPDVHQHRFINCLECVTSLVDLLSSYALLTNNILIELDAKEEMYVRGSRNELNQVLLNIMKNGIEAMRNGGTLRVGLYKREGHVHIQIEDTGIGMTSEQVNRLGTAFYSLKEKGTGIGLMVSYQLVEQMNGRIEVESIPGKGSTFTLIFPSYD
ncbi:ATP-binding protein [Priestia megaterium]|jgi:two-component system, sporulation sensor kinase B|uniref:histidine kinase n=2 Tax=Priestia TaxID=2800373 RepID=D5DPW6_PRIM1|nr:MULTISPECIES: ATP-binding protein [Priestia]KOP76051.1 histidine kinase [Bacillus sp. FJAT-21351]KQU22881.1 histidine kinase [Bacillus sp. Leaf75]MBZ5478446.1 HAMP domain-containing protein [Bacillus sp. T_4]ADE71067.1 two-component sensor histidine kinase [Priestia megaterium QM B1551]KAA8748263.1 HAMP domain-containing protein [Priestia megaterium]